MSHTDYAPDYSWVEWFGNRFEFNADQARCVRVLWRAWLGGTPIIREAEVLLVASVRAKALKDIFKAPPGNAAWGTLIHDGDRRGTVRLVEPTPGAPLASTFEPGSVEIDPCSTD